MAWREWTSPRGSMSVVMAAVIAVIVICAGVLGAGVAHAASAAHAQGAADLAALAAAQRARALVATGVASGEVTSQACALAADVATRNSVQVTRCAVVRADVSVEVTHGAGLSRARAVATAGPRHRIGLSG